MNIQEMNDMYDIFYFGNKSYENLNEVQESAGDDTM